VTFRLTELAAGGGCAAKLRLGALTDVLAQLAPTPASARGEIVVDRDFSDDAAVVRVSAGRDLVLTADVIAPLVDDPEAFGAIAATNAMSDVWAMGGEPRFALNLVFFPDDQVPIEILHAILAGSARACAAAGVAVVGGHSVRGECKFGLSVTGEVAPGELWTNRTARAGQALVLTKALGTGILAQAIKKQLAAEASAAAAIASMTTLNRDAARIGKRHGVTAATDVTGFGLLGHLRNLVRGSEVAATVELAALPILPDALVHLRAAVCPAGSKANRAFIAPLVAWGDGAPFTAEPSPERDPERELLASIACDAQTSGGLLLCVPAERAEALVDALRAAALPAARIGALHRRTDERPIRLT
jgi:selenide,water dikinase